MIEVPGARFSDDRRYRYLLTRRVGTGKKRVMFLMLNPSTADEVRNDPTIARCIGFASSWDCGWLYVTNLSPLRATDPADVLRVGPEPDDVWDTNVENILETAMCCDFTVAAWGNHGAAEGRADRVIAEAWGDSTTFFMSHSGLDAGNGSTAITSRPAPATAIALSAGRRSGPLRQ